MKQKSSKDNGVPRSKAAGRAATGSLRSVAKKRPSPSHPSRADAQKAKHHRLYKRMLKFLDNNPHRMPGGFCSLLILMGSSTDVASLTELSNQRPKDRIWCSFWWTPYVWSGRIAALKKAIKLTAPKVALGIAAKSPQPKARTRSGKPGASRATPKPTKKTTPTLKRKT